MAAMSSLPRRQVLRAAGTLGGVALSAAAAGRVGQGLAWATTVSGPSAADWRALVASIDGDVVRRSDRDYDRTKLLRNTRFDATNPLAIVEATGAADVSEAIRFARRFRLRFRSRSGGHSYVGASTVDNGLILDVRRMQSVTYDGGSGVATVGAGARSHRIHAVLAGNGRSIPTGTCPTVAAAGLTLGGGLGIDSCRHGLSCDALTGLTMVTADGKVRRVGESHEADLWWASRGGGGGNFGVATSLRYSSHAAQRMGVFALSFAWEHARSVVRGWAARIQVIPRSVWCNLRLEAGADGVLRVRLGGCCAPGGQDDEALALQRAIGVDATSATTFERSFMNGMEYFGGGTTTPRQATVSGSDVVATMSETLVQALPGIVERRAHSGAASSVILDPLTGAVSDLRADVTAFPWRDHLAELQWHVQLPDDPSKEAVMASREWVNGAHQAIASESVGAYVNHLEAGRPLGDYYGANFERLRRIRADVDPTGFFRSAYSI